MSPVFVRVLFVKVSGDIVSKLTLAESLAHKRKSVLAREPIFRRAFDYLALTNILDLAKLLESRFETFEIFRTFHRTDYLLHLAHLLLIFV